MAELSSEILATVATLQGQLLAIINEATAVDFLLTRNVGETAATIESFEDLASIREKATGIYSRLSVLLLRIAEYQPATPIAMMQLLIATIEQGQEARPALVRSIEEVKLNWGLT